MPHRSPKGAIKSMTYYEITYTRRKVGQVTVIESEAVYPLDHLLVKIRDTKSKPARRKLQKEYDELAEKLNNKPID